MAPLTPLLLLINECWSEELPREDVRPGGEDGRGGRDGGSRPCVGEEDEEEDEEVGNEEEDEDEAVVECGVSACV